MVPEDGTTEPGMRIVVTGVLLHIRWLRDFAYRFDNTGDKDRMTASRAFSGTTWVVVLAVAAIAIVTVVCRCFPEKAEVTGREPADRVAEICRVADEQLRGAGDAIAAAAKDKDPSVRHASLVALSKFIDPKYRSLVETGARDPDARVRSAAARTLGLYDDDKAIVRLGELA